MRACESPFDSSQAQAHSSLGVCVPYAQGPPPAWLPTPDSIADTNLAAFMQDFKVRGERVFLTRHFFCVPRGLPAVLSRQGARVWQGLVPVAQALAKEGTAPEVLWGQQPDSVRAGSVFLASDLQPF